MKRSLFFLIATVCAASALQAAAATPSQSSAVSGTSAPGAEQQAKGVKTGDWEYATPQMLPLTPQPVRSWGAAVLPGPRNTHASSPHGGLITAGDRSNMFGRE